MIKKCICKKTIIRWYIFVIILCFIAAIAQCDFFNLNVPEYIDKYTGTAGVVQNEEISPVPYGINQMGARVISPTETITLKLRLRNPKNYDLIPVLYTWNGGWTEAGFAINGAPISAEYVSPDIVLVKIDRPSLGDTFQLKLSLKTNDDTRREFSQYALNLPLLKFNEFPPVPEIIDIVPGDSGGLRLSWVLEKRGNISDANKMIVLCSQAGIEAESYNISALSGSGTSMDPYTMTVFSGKTIGTATVGLRVFNEDNLDTFAAREFTTAPASTYEGSVLYVAMGGAGSGDGSTWADATGNLQGAIDAAAASGNTITHVLVKEGTYYPASWPNSTESEKSDPRNKHFSLRNNVTVIGGFAGTETGIVPQGSQTRTILSGDIGTAGNKNDNAYHVFYHPAALDLTAVLKNVTVSGGNANGGGHQKDGAAMYNSAGGASISGCIFRDNEASAQGGALYNSSSSPLISNCTFTLNKASGGSGTGGAVFNYGGSPQITDTGFTGNEAVNQGGAIFNSSSSPKLSSCAFTANRASGSGGTGGAVYSYGGSPEMESCIFDGNEAVSQGGAVYNNNNTPKISGSTFSANTVTGSSGSGGAIYNYQSPAYISACGFTANEAAFSGGIYNNASNTIITLSTFSGNTSRSSSGGGIYNLASSPEISGSSFTGNTAADSGGGIFNSGGTPQIIACTFSGNTAAGTSGKGAGGGICNEGSSAVMRLSTFYGNTALKGGGIYNNASAALIICCTISENESSLGSANGGGGIFNENNSPMPGMYGSIVLGNMASGSEETKEVLGSFSARIDNLIKGNGQNGTVMVSAGDVFTDVISNNPQLKNNGGPTGTLMVKDASATRIPNPPAWPAGLIPAGDQRNYTRQGLGYFYIGAVDPNGTAP